MRRSALTALLALVAISDSSFAQEPRFFYPAPPASAFSVTTDVPYDGRQMDVYRPRDNEDRRPALIFFNLASGAARKTPLYQRWAEIAASKGLVAILPDLRSESLA